MESRDEILFKEGRFVTPSVLHCKSFTKTCHEHHVYVLMHVIKCVDHVYLKVSPMRGVHQFSVRGKLAPRYVGPYKVLGQCGPVAYRLQLLDILSIVHNLFHVSQLKKCLRVPNEAVEVEGLPLQPDLSYIKHPVKILDEKERVTRNSVVKLYKVQWQNHSKDEATWEQESYILKHYPHLLSS